MDSAGNVYVADTNNNRIQKFTSTGTFITQWGGYGSEDGQFDSPGGVAVDSAGNVYVADWNNNRIQKFTSTGGFITNWGGSGSADGQFNGPGGVAVDSAGNVYVADTNNNRIQKFTSTGTFITKWGGSARKTGSSTSPVVSRWTAPATSTWPTRQQPDPEVHVERHIRHQMGQFRLGRRAVRYPEGIAVDSAGNVYVADYR